MEGALSGGSDLDPNYVPDGWLDDLPPPPAKKLKLSLNRKSSTSGQVSRFVLPVSEEQFTEAAKGVVPTNTKKNEWAERTFTALVEERNKVQSIDAVPSDLLSYHDGSVVCKYMRCFVLEARTHDGKKYPPATLRCILSGLNRIMKESNAPFSILDKTNPSFRELHLTLDIITSDLHREGVGVYKKSALVIHENLFWEKRLLGYDAPKSLQRALIRLNFVLRGVQEQHNLQLEQLSRSTPETSVYSEKVYYEYIYYHRFKDINVSSKYCRVYAQPGSVRCVVHLLDFYISKLPPNPAAFYLRPLDKVPSDNKPWYCKSRVGVNKLKMFLPEISAESGLSVHYTLRATAVTQMYNTGVPEKLFAEKSGHRSLKALRIYEKTSEYQDMSAGQSIQCGKPFNSVSIDKENSDPKFDKQVNVPKECPSGEPKSGAKALQQFSGLTNCTSNFYQS